MGSSCCRPKNESPRVSLSKAFARLSQRVFPHSGRTIKIAEAEKRLSTSSYSKSRPSVSEPLFVSSTIDEGRNHVTLLLPDAPSVPPRKKKPRLAKKRVSFQSDVDIMSSTKSLEKGLGEAVAEAKVRRRSLDSLLQAAEEEVTEPRPPQRRTSSLEVIPGEDWLTKQAAIAALKAEDMRLTARLRRDTLGNALDIHSYRRPLPDSTLPGTMEEDSDGSLEELSSGLSAKLRRDTLATIALKRQGMNTMEELEEEEDTESSIEDLPLSSLHLKIRRDTLGLALKPGYFRSEEANDEVDEGPSPLDSSTEDLATKLKHSKLCNKLRRDTFGDALRQAVKCKACSSFEDITDLENDEINLQEILENHEDEELHEVSVAFVDEIIEKALSIVEGETGRKEIDKSKSAWLSNILKEGENTEEPEKNNNTVTSPLKKVKFTDGEIASVLERMRGVEAKEPYTVVYTSPKPVEAIPRLEEPITPLDESSTHHEVRDDVQSNESTTDEHSSLTIPGITISPSNDPPSRKSSTTSSLQEFETSIYEMLAQEEEKDKRMSLET